MLYNQSLAHQQLYKMAMPQRFWCSSRLLLRAYSPVGKTNVTLDGDVFVRNLLRGRCPLYIAGLANLFAGTVASTCVRPRCCASRLSVRVASVAAARQGPLRSGNSPASNLSRQVLRPDLFLILVSETCVSTQALEKKLV